MDRKKKDSIIGTAAFVILLAILFGSIATSEAESYEIDDLEGYKWLLHWATMGYLPIFPIVSALLCFPMTGNYKLEIPTINAVITLVFALFAWVLHYQYVSWTLLLIGNIIFVGIMMHDERNDEKQ